MRLHVLQPSKPQPDKAVIADLRELLEAAEAGELVYIAYVSMDADGSALGWEVGQRDPHHVAGRLMELATDIMASEREDDE